MDGKSHPLRRLRECLGLSQKDAAKALGLSSGHLSDVERRKKRPTMDTLDAWAKHVGVRTSAILAYIENAESERPEDQGEARVFLFRLLP